jgi:hypothetical protein
MAHHRNMGRSRQGNTPLQKTKNVIEDSVENEENEHTVAETGRMIISLSNESSEIFKNMGKEELKMSSWKCS